MSQKDNNQQSYEILNQRQILEYAVGVIWLMVGIAALVFNTNKEMLPDVIALVAAFLAYMKYRYGNSYGVAKKAFLPAEPKPKPDVFFYQLKDGQILSVDKKGYYLSEQPITNQEFIKYLYSWAEEVEKTTFGFRLELKASRGIIGEFKPEKIIFNDEVLADNTASEKIWKAMLMIEFLKGKS